MIKPKYSQTERSIMRNHSDTDIAQMLRADLVGLKALRDLRNAAVSCFSPVCERALLFMHRPMAKQ